MHIKVMTVMQAPQQMFQYFGEPPYVRLWKHNLAEIKTLQKMIMLDNATDHGLSCFQWYWAS